MLEALVPTLNQIVADVNAAWALSGDRVCLGEPLKPVLGRDYAVIDFSEPVVREPFCRMVRETYEFEVYGRFAYDSSTPVFHFCASKAEALKEQFCPSEQDLAGVMASEGLYAGVCSSWEVTEIGWGEGPPDDPRVIVALKFVASAIVNE